MIIAFSTGSLTGVPLPTIFKLGRRAGADGVELMLTSRIASRSPSHIRELEQRYDLPVRSVHTIMRLQDASPEQLASDILQSAHFARSLLQCTVLVVHPPPVQSLHSAAANTWLAAIESALDLTEDLSLQVTVENVGRLSNDDPATFFDHPDRLLRLAQEWRLGITYDTSHAASREWEIVDTGARFLPHLSNIHLSDYNRRSYRPGLANAFLRDHQIPGEGVLPLDDLLNRMATGGYDGLVTLELSPFALHLPWLPSAANRLRHSIGTCRAAVASGLPAPQRSRHPNHP
ncbi:MAG TPA: sugar phosphate isomerase/epimerase [Thermomicrobiaceae bacterium]|nr:sugar phosphate isomerase/epimerase [Thermomicrobiaceae bacterium]